MSNTDLRINAKRLRNRLETLSHFGRPPGGTFRHGVTRLSYSEADISARSCVMKMMEDAGLKPRIDTAGNILASTLGSQPRLPGVLFGSHIDSVRNGGNFDGALGAMAAIEVVKTLNERQISTRRSLEVVIWADEEGCVYGDGFFGSRAAAGILIDGEIERTEDGVRKADAVRKIGGGLDRIHEARRPPGSFQCYLELHIEQGSILEKAGVPIGIVEGIITIDRYEAAVQGHANRAGTTPMACRQDALVAASHLVLAVHEAVRNEPGDLVGTIGQMAVSPNMLNVIPGFVRLSIDLRALYTEKLESLRENIRKAAVEIAAKTHTKITITPTSHSEGCIVAPALQQAIEASANRLGLPSRRLVSAGGHDAQSMARLAPAGMIFVPSVAGVSHSPEEFTHWEDCARGADVLLETVLALANSEETLHRPTCVAQRMSAS